MKRFESVKIELLDPTKVPADYHQFDYTKLTATATCPTWGILRYGLHKTMGGAGRAMALEAGTACHEFFASHRIYKLGWEQGLRDHADFHGTRLFGYERFHNAVSVMSESKSTLQNRRDFCLDILYTSGYVDDPGDSRRTLSNLEMTCMTYLMSWEGQELPVWVSDPSKPTSLVGIEIPFAIGITFMHEDYSHTFGDLALHQLKIAYTGRIDGLHIGSRGSITLVENKTGARLDDAWRQSFYTSHQVTGYHMAAQLACKAPVEDVYVIGAQIPLPKNYENGIVWQHTTRQSHQFERWLDWIFDVASVHVHHKANVLEAPMYTHSCNRYFRPCSMIPFCVADNEERAAILEEMAVDEWSPLHEKAGE